MEECGLLGSAAEWCARSVSAHGSVPIHGMDSYERSTEHELYDLEADPKEYQNLANSPEHGEIQTRLSSELQAGWRDAQPSPVRISQQGQ